MKHAQCDMFNVSRYRVSPVARRNSYKPNLRLCISHDLYVGYHGTTTFFRHVFFSSGTTVIPSFFTLTTVNLKYMIVLKFMYHSFCMVLLRIPLCYHGTCPKSHSSTMSKKLLLFSSGMHIYHDNATFFFTFTTVKLWF